jgi:hypothetical protein
MEHGHQQREDERFVDGGINQRPLFLPFADPQILADQNDLGQDQGSSVLEDPSRNRPWSSLRVGGKSGEQGARNNKTVRYSRNSWIALCLRPALFIVLALPEPTPSFATIDSAVLIRTHLNLKDNRERCWTVNLVFLTLTLSQQRERR